MKSKYFLGLLLTSAAALATAGGCGSSTDTDGSGGRGGDDASASSASSTASSTTVATGTGGAPGPCGADKDNNCGFETAEEIEQNAEEFEAELEPVDEDVDYYTFEGTKGQALYIYTTAKTGMDPFDPRDPDLVITMYDENKQQIAENDDPFPRRSNDSEIYTILPADGTYYVRVLECNAWEKGGPSVCSAAGDIEDTSYTFGILRLDPTLQSVTGETAPDNTEAMPDAVKYQKAGMMAGAYVISTVDGFYSDMNDRDVYSFKLPTDYVLGADERLVGYFSLLPSGPTGNGSTAPTGEISIVDPTTMIAVAKIDGSLSEDMSPPLQADKDYLLFVDAPKMGGDFAANPFYFVLHNGGGSNPVEKEKLPLENDTTAMAEVLTAAMGTQSFFVEGDVTIAGTDVDFFSMTVPTGMTKANMICGAQRSGSGLRSFKMSLIGKDGTTVIKTGVEAADADLLFQDLNVTAGDMVYLKVEAAMQDPAVTSTFYRCGVHFRAM
jgi:hypothetical protein